LHFESADLNATNHIDNSYAGIGGFAKTTSRKLPSMAVEDTLASFDVELGN
jgi:hypothetical protein